jgi:hypothetical protein
MPNLQEPTETETKIAELEQEVKRIATYLDNIGRIVGGLWLNDQIDPKHILPKHTPPPFDPGVHVD